MVISAERFIDQRMRAFCEAAEFYDPAFERLPVTALSIIFKNAGIKTSTSNLVLSILDTAIQTIGGAYQVGDIIKKQSQTDKGKIIETAKLLIQQENEKAQLIETRERQWDKFLNSVKQNNPTPVQTLKFLRAATYKFQRNLAQEVGVSRKTISFWENGKRDTYLTKLGKLAEKIPLSDVEAERFILIMRPDIILPSKSEDKLKKWLKEKIAAKKWDDISFPALDDVWLDLQSKDMQARLLLPDLMEKHNITATALGNAIGGDNEHTIISFIKGDINFKTFRAGEFVGALEKCPPEKVLKFISLIHSHLVPEESEQKVAIEKWFLARIKAQDKKAVSFPALHNDKWLDTQPIEKQGGILLSEIIDSKKLVRKDIYEDIDVQKHTLSDWETGKYPISPSKIGTLITKLHIPVKESEKLVARARPDLFPEDGAAQKIVKTWLHKKVVAKDWRNIWLPALGSSGEWIKTQPPRRHAGLWLRDLIEEQKESGQVSTRSTLCREFDISEPLMSRWISGEKPIQPDKLALITARLINSEERKQKFEEVVAISNTAIAEFQTSMKKVKTTTLGASAKANDSRQQSLQNDNKHERN
jgi:DNA-binding XRE family transcriptional regulator